jgi:hypothetical protein
MRSYVTGRDPGAPAEPEATFAHGRQPLAGGVQTTVVVLGPDQGGEQFEPLNVEHEPASERLAR